MAKIIVWHSYNASDIKMASFLLHLHNSVFSMFQIFLSFGKLNYNKIRYNLFACNVDSHILSL